MFAFEPHKNTNIYKKIFPEAVIQIQEALDYIFSVSGVLLPVVEQSHLCIVAFLKPDHISAGLRKKVRRYYEAEAGIMYIRRKTIWKKSAGCIC